MNFTDYLNEGYSKELSKQLKAYGLAKKVGDWLADNGVSVNDAETRTDLDEIIDGKPLGITSAIKEIKNRFLSNFRGGYVIFVHSTKGVTLIKTVKPGFRDVNINKDSRTEFGDTDGKIISVYVIEASHEDFSRYRSGATKQKQQSRRDRQSGEDSLETMKKRRDYTIKKRDKLNNALENKTIKKIYDILTGVGFKIERASELPIVTNQYDNFYLQNVNAGINSDVGPDIRLYIDGGWRSISGLDAKVVAKVEINVSSSSYNYSANAKDDITREYRALADVSDAISKVSEIIKNSTYNDLLVD